MASVVSPSVSAVRPVAVSVNSSTAPAIGRPVPASRTRKSTQWPARRITLPRSVAPATVSGSNTAGSSRVLTAGANATRSAPGVTTADTLPAASLCGLTSASRCPLGRLSTRQSTPATGASAEVSVRANRFAPAGSVTSPRSVAALTTTRRSARAAYTGPNGGTPMMSYVPAGITKRATPSASVASVGVYNSAPVAGSCT